MSTKSSQACPQNKAFSKSIPPTASAGSRIRLHIRHMLSVSQWLGLDLDGGYFVTCCIFFPQVIRPLARSLATLSSAPEKNKNKLKKKKKRLLFALHLEEIRTRAVNPCTAELANEHQSKAKPCLAKLWVHLWCGPSHHKPRTGTITILLGTICNKGAACPLRLPSGLDLHTHTHTHCLSLAHVCLISCPSTSLLLLSCPFPLFRPLLPLWPRYPSYQSSSISIRPPQSSLLHLLILRRDRTKCCGLSSSLSCHRSRQKRSW